MSLLKSIDLYLAIVFFITLFLLAISGYFILDSVIASLFIVLLIYLVYKYVE